MMKRIIVNADDCGMSSIVNEHIERAILAGKITSTTVMANMDGFDGVMKLYKNYHDTISFGWHINLTEGTPLLKSQLLLDKGYYAEQNGQVVFNGKSFWKKSISEEMKMAIKKELIAQYEKICDHGIQISHADSHHHIHTSRGLMYFVPSLLTELGITKMRRMRNFVPFSINFLIRQVVTFSITLTVPNLKMTNTFGSFGEFVKKPHLHYGSSLELECHPGHPKYEEEEQLLMAYNHNNNVKLISYYEL